MIALHDATESLLSPSTKSRYHNHFLVAVDGVHARPKCCISSPGYFSEQFGKFAGKQWLI